MKEEADELNYQFKEKIRRRNIDELFSKRRKEVLQELQNDQSIQSPDQELLTRILHDTHLLNIQTLKTLAKVSADETAVRQLTTPEFVTSLMAYLDAKHLSSNEQYYASFIICNIFCVSSCRALTSK